MTMLIYAGTAIAFLILVLVLLAKDHFRESNDTLTKEDYAEWVGGKRWLSLSERIFDPSDVRWLREELAYPEFADSLTRARQQLAIHWLRALQASFIEIVRTPEFVPLAGSQVDSTAGLQVMWRSVRFQILLFYALVVVSLFGPYHRLIPSFSWLPLLRGNDTALQRPILIDDGESR